MMRFIIHCIVLFIWSREVITFVCLVHEVASIKWSSYVNLYTNKRKPVAESILGRTYLAPPGEYG